MNKEQKLITAGEPHPSLYGKDCDACGKDWVMKDEKDVICPDKIKITKDCLSSTFREFRRMCAEYFGKELE